MRQSAASGGFYGGLMGLGMGATFGAAQHIYKAFTTPKPPTIESQRLSGTTLTPTKAGIPVNSNSKAPEVKPVVETPAHPQTNTGNTGGGFHQPSTKGVNWGGDDVLANFNSKNPNKMVNMEIVSDHSAIDLWNKMADASPKLSIPRVDANTVHSGFTNANGITFSFYKGGGTNALGYTIQAQKPDGYIYLKIRFNK
jgi:hypothetical protein